MQKIVLAIFISVFLFSCKKSISIEDPIKIDKEKESEDKMVKEPDNPQLFDKVEKIIYEPMNNIDGNTIILYGKDGTKHSFYLEGDEGSYSYEYGINKVYISYWNKSATFDDEYQYWNYYFPNLYQDLEKSIQNNDSDFQSHYFNQNRRKNDKNGIIFVDSFVFSAHEAEDQQLIRRIFLTTKLFNICISFHISNKENMRNAIKESSQYFKIRLYSSDTDVEYFDGPITNGHIVWDYKNNAVERFGDDLLNAIHPGQIVNDWYNETEEILNGLSIK